MAAKPKDFNIYINWLLFAISGRIDNAEKFIRQNKAAVYRVAKDVRAQMAKKGRTKTGRLYRGMLLREQDLLDDSMLAQHGDYSFVSFSENFDVACWFADRASSMSSYVAMIRPETTGFIMEYQPKPIEVLFSHKWDGFKMPNGKRLYLEEAAKMHPQIALIADQVEWCLATQQEVITKPLSTQKVQSIELYDCPSTSELDLMFDFKPGR